MRFFFLLLSVFPENKEEDHTCGKDDCDNPRWQNRAISGRWSDGNIGNYLALVHDDEVREVTSMPNKMSVFGFGIQFFDLAAIGCTTHNIF